MLVTIPCHVAKINLNTVKYNTNSTMFLPYWIRRIVSSDENSFVTCVAVLIFWNQFEDSLETGSKVFYAWTIFSIHWNPGLWTNYAEGLKGELRPK